MASPLFQTHDWLNFWCRQASSNMIIKQGLVSIQLFFLIFDIEIHYSDVMMSAMASQITGVLIVYLAINSDADKKNMKVPRHWPLWGEFTGYQWIPHTKGQ